MSDWKKKIDDREEKEQLEAQRQKEIQIIKSDTERKAREESNRREFENNLLKLSKRFRCHVCSSPAKAPYEIARYYPGESDDGFGRSGGWTEHRTDWEKPADLWRCSICNKWTCKECLYKGICKTCAEKLP